MIAAALLAWSAAAPASEPSFPELELAAAVPVDGSDGLDLSGLALRGRTLYAVSDKDDARIFRIVLAPGHASARLEPAVPITLPPDSGKGRCDWEGLDIAPDGRWLLASELKHRVLALPAKGGTGTWITPNLQPAARPHGMLQVTNAGLEGLTAGPGGTLILAAERQNRGLIEIAPGRPAVFFPLTTSITRLHPPRVPDLAAVEWTGTHLLGLYRNAELLVRLEKKDGAWNETRAWSFRQTVRRPDLRYIAATFGMVEGLALSKDFIYLCADNNRSGRATDPADRRGLLYIFKRPPEL
jgi:uncharacterized protein YjiK